MTRPASQATPLTLTSRQVSASIILGSLAILVFGIQPLLYTAFVSEGLIEPDNLGLLSAAEVIAIAMGSSLVVPALKRIPVATIAGAAILVVASANYFQARYGNAHMLFGFRMLSGFGSGFLVGIGGVAIAATRKVGQWAAAYLLAQAISQFLHLQWFALFLPSPTSTDLLMSLAIVSAAALGGLPFLPTRLGGNGTIETGNARRKPDANGIRWLAVMFLFVGGALTVWAYAGVWLESENVSAPTAAKILSSSLAGQAAGAFVACLVPSGSHDRHRLAFTTSLLLISAGAWLIWPSSFVAATGFGFWWLASVPVLSSILSEVDPHRATLPFAPAAQLAGIAVIPTAAGLAFAASDVALVPVSGCAAIGLSLALGLARRRKRITGPHASNET